MHDQGDITLYDLVVTDRASGRARTVNEGAPIEGRYRAEEQARAMERSNRNPVLQYSVQPSKTRRNSEQPEIVPESLLTHKFRAYGR